MFLFSYPFPSHLLEIGALAMKAQLMITQLTNTLLWVPNFQQPLFVITLSALPSSYLDHSVRWVGNS